MNKLEKRCGRRVTRYVEAFGSTNEIWQMLMRLGYTIWTIENSEPEIETYFVHMWHDNEEPFIAECVFYHNGVVVEIFEDKKK
jgi:hypothetical protein